MSLSDLKFTDFQNPQGHKCGTLSNSVQVSTYLPQSGVYRIAVNIGPDVLKKVNFNIGSKVRVMWATEKPYAIKLMRPTQEGYKLYTISRINKSKHGRIQMVMPPGIVPKTQLSRVMDHQITNNNDLIVALPDYDEIQTTNREKPNDNVTYLKQAELKYPEKDMVDWFMAHEKEPPIDSYILGVTKEYVPIIASYRYDEGKGNYGYFQMIQVDGEKLIRPLDNIQFWSFIPKP